MSAAALPLARERRSFGLWELLKQELAYYPGRGSQVVRMTLAATLTMLCIMAGHLPQGALGGYYALVVARENFQSTLKQSLQLIGCFALATLYIELGAALFMGSPPLHFLWVIGSLFMLFFVMSTAANFGLAGGFALLITAGLPVWDGPGGVNTKIALTLYTCFTISIGTLSALLVEAVYRAFRPADPILTGLTDRLRVAGDMLLAAAEGRGPEKRDRARLEQYAMVGTSALRRGLVRSARSAGVRARASAAISVGGRLVELCAGALDEMERNPSPDDRERLRRVGAAVRARAAEVGALPGVEFLGTSRLPVWQPSDAPSKALPNLPEIERAAALFGQILDSFGGSEAESEQAWQKGILEARAREAGGLRFFKPDTFTNREHIRFALRGCLAASLCYVVYVGIDWLGIDTALRTCVATGLGTIGSSRQKQALRIAGAVFGGFVLALPAQVYILPHLDSIVGFTLFFAPAAALAAWITTSSARLSYFGLQVALAFFLVNIEEPYEQISLAVARDRVFGILLGLVAMWLIFDRIGSRDAATQMGELLRANLRGLAGYGELVGTLAERVSGEDLNRIRKLRGEINDSFSRMNAQADAVLFEFGSERARKLALRDRMQAMQPAMRSIFLSEIALYESEHAAHGAERSRPALRAFLSRSRAVLEALAGPSPLGPERAAAAMEDLREALPAVAMETGGRQTPALCQGIARSLRTLAARAVES